MKFIYVDWNTFASNEALMKCFMEALHTRVYFDPFYGEPVGHTAVIFRGDIINKLAAESGLKYSLSALAECYYKPYVNGAGDRINVKRCTMHPKTMANLERGSRRYGHLHISQEADTFWE